MQDKFKTLFDNKVIYHIIYQKTVFGVDVGLDYDAGTIVSSSYWVQPGYSVQDQNRKAINVKNFQRVLGLKAGSYTVYGAYKIPAVVAQDQRALPKGKPIPYD